ncbi:MAG: hypothetical protein ABL909_01725 [Sphingopyxis sp.]
MPGFVGLIAIVFACVFAFAIAAFVCLLLKWLFKLSWGRAFSLGILAGALLAGAGLIGAFRPTQHSISEQEALERFPEISQFDGEFAYGLYFQDGLSDGEYYSFSFSPERLASLEHLVVESREQLDADDVFGLSYSNFEPNWYRPTRCSGARHYGDVRVRDEDSPYIYRFSLHICPKTGQLFADWVRI